MDITLYLTFLVVSFGLIIVPGPNVLVIVSTSITHGTKRGLQTVAGTSLAMAIQLLVIASSTAWLVQVISNGLHYLKWVGVAYLLYLAIYHLNAAFSAEKKEIKITSSATFRRGFLVSLTNPKTLFFFSAFLPQFVTSAGSYNIQIFLLSLSFLIMAIILDSCYALLSSKLSLLVKERFLNRFRNGFAGLLYLWACAWLATTNRSS
jgi:homoserine/homoserine lactone efflux protein